VEVPTGPHDTAREVKFDVVDAPGRPVRAGFGGPMRCWDNWARLSKGGLRTE